MTNVERRRAATPLYELIYGVLREHIEDGSFPPGLVLGEAIVARAFRRAACRQPRRSAASRGGLAQAFPGSRLPCIPKRTRRLSAVI